MSRPSIEEVLAQASPDRYSPPSDEERVDALAAAAEDGPLRSADGTLVVHRADPELSGFLNEWADELNGYEREHADQNRLRRAARLVAGDPVEEKL